MWPPRLLFWCCFVLALVYGDPAPGRSPGPPATSSSRTQLTVTHAIFDIRPGLVPGVKYQVALTPSTPGTVELSTEPSTIGTWDEGNWTGHPQGKLQNVTFRARVDGQDIASASFRLLNECRLWIWPPRGRLMSSHLPPNAVQCRLEFGPRGGVLLELFRLNAPCQAGGFLALEGRRDETLCGKLEELPLRHRKIQALPPPSPIALLVRAPVVFALSYREVAACHEVPLRGPRGSTKVRFEPGLRCAYRLRLPAGQRVDINIDIYHVNETVNDTSTLNRVSPSSAPSLLMNGNSATASSVPDSNLTNRLLEETTLVANFPYESSDDPLYINGDSLQTSSDSLLTEESLGESLEDALEDSNQGGLASAIESLELETASVETDPSSLSSDDSSSKSKQDHSNCDSSVTTPVIIEITEEASNLIWRHCQVGIRAIYHSTGSATTIRVLGGTFILASVLEVAISWTAQPDHSIEAGCGYGWIRAGTSCLAVLGESRPLNWRSAEAECHREGGHLVSVDSPEKQRIISALIQASPEHTESSAYWIGASDLGQEGEFRWTDGTPFVYTNWFPGWEGSNRQPNDDGLSHQDCVELRRAFSSPPPSTTDVDGLTLISSTRLSSTPMWNDRDCSVQNPYVCERVSFGLTRSEVGVGSATVGPNCNVSVSLSEEQPSVWISSPGFPERYPDDALCFTHITCPQGRRISIEFSSLILEAEPGCSYDRLEVWQGRKRLRLACGDWTSRIKLLRIRGDISLPVTLRFRSDYSRRYPGYKAHAYLESEEGSFRLEVMVNPGITSEKAEQNCQTRGGHLAPVPTTHLERLSLFRTLRDVTGTDSPLDVLPPSYYWLAISSIKFPSFDIAYPRDSAPQHCVAVATDAPDIRSVACNEPLSGYICRVPSLGSFNGLQNSTQRGLRGVVTSPGWPGIYPSDVDVTTQIQGPPRTRLTLRITLLDIEWQPECLYDFLEISDPGSNRLAPLRLCGRLPPNDEYVTDTDTAWVRFRTDWSKAGKGFSLKWEAIDVAGCPNRLVTALEGHLQAKLLPRLNCTTILQAPPGRRVWLELKQIDLLQDASLQIDVGDGLFDVPLKDSTDFHLASGAYLSLNERLQVRIVTGEKPKGDGFIAHYQAVSKALDISREIDLTNETRGDLWSLNSPASRPPGAVQRLIFHAPPGTTVRLELRGVRLPDSFEYCKQRALFILDPYAVSAENGTSWTFCPDDNVDVPVSVQSYLHTITVIDAGYTPLDANVRVVPDPEYKVKLVRLGPEGRPISDCSSARCLHGAPCNGGRCRCGPHHTGTLCALTLCDFEPCSWGKCELRAEGGYHCSCQPGYTGAYCDRRLHPCASTPCDGRGECIETGVDDFVCKCHAWWQGPRCEKRIQRIPYKPLSERMLHEPFWLGLITVFLVLVALGLIWCAKRHLPDKLEKLLSEETDRCTRGFGPLPSGPGSTCGSSAMVQAGQGGTVVVIGGTSASVSGRSPQRGGSLLGRLGIMGRASSSTGGPGGRRASAAHAAASRALSLDNLLGPPPATHSRTPSPGKRRNNSTPTRRTGGVTNAAEKRQLLQGLVAASAAAASKQAQMEEITSSERNFGAGELLHLTERRRTSGENTGLGSDAETVFSTIGCGTAGAASSSSSSDPTYDPKHEKKVTFARLLSRVSAEMSSGSELELGGGNSSGTSTVSRLAQLSGLVVPISSSRPNSMPPSPGAAAISAVATVVAVANTAGHGSLSSLESKFPPPSSGNKVLMPGRNPSADSLLAMFRSISSTTTTPSASSPQEPCGVGSDQSTPLSSPTPSGHLYLNYQSDHTIQVPVLDASSASSALLHPPAILLEPPTCLSPIREVPTPSPSPAVTPLMPPRSPNLMEQSNTGPSLNCLMVPTFQQRLPFRLPIPGSPPPQRARTNNFEPPSTFITPASPSPNKMRRTLKDIDKPTSLDLPCPPPLITVTCSLSDAESDGENNMNGKNQQSSCPPSSSNTGPSGMTYLSPFSMCPRPDRAPSESNLSSSGYSSMASPGPSRCGSHNPLCPSELDEPPPTGGSGGGAGIGQGPSPAAPAAAAAADSESHDEGIGTDQLDERIEDQAETKIKSLSCLEPPSILIEPELLSSRSESPLSPGCRSAAIVTGSDSDGAYDNLSTGGGVNSVPPPPPRRAPRPRRERRPSSKSTATLISPSSTRSILIVPATSRKPSPKRSRTRSGHSALHTCPVVVCPSSSSEESLTGCREVPNSCCEDNRRKSLDASGEETAEEISPLESTPVQRKVSRLRTISHQIRFLRRLELSIRRREASTAAAAATAALFSPFGKSPSGEFSNQSITDATELLVPEADRSWSRVRIATLPTIAPSDPLGPR